MKVWIKYIGLIVVATVFVPVVLMVGFVFLVDPNDVKEQLIEVVEANTGGYLSINGTISWSFFPSLSLALNQLEYRLPNDKNAPLAVLNEAKLSVKLLPLFRQSIETDGLTIKGLNLNLHTDKNGVNNWDSLLVSGSKLASKEGPSKDNSDALAVNIATLSLLSSSITFNNDLDNKRYALQAVNIESTGINTSGQSFPLSIAFNAELSEPALKTQVNLKTELRANSHKKNYSFEKFIAKLDVSGDMLNDKNVDLTLEGQGAYNTASQQVALNNMAINLADVLKLALQADVTKLDTQPSIVGDISVAPFSMNELLKVIGLEPLVFKNPKALSALSIKTNFSGSANDFIFSDLELELDKTQFSGNAGVRSFSANEYFVALEGDRLNLDNYAAPVLVPTSEEPVTDKTNKNEVLLPLDTLKDLSINAVLGFDKLRVNDLSFTELAVVASADKGLLNLQKLAADFYEGAIDISASIDVRRNMPLLKLKAKVTGVDVQKVAADVAQLENLAGLIEADAQMNMEGNSLNLILNSLSGSVEFDIENALFDGVNVDELACTAIAQVRGESVDEKVWPTTTSFNKIGGLIRFNNGIGQNDNLLAALDNMQINGNGLVNLPANRVDYRLALRINGDLAEPQLDEEGVAIKSACSINKKYRDVTWPLRCNGSMSASPGDLCGIDTERLAKVSASLLKAEVKSTLLKKLFDSSKSSDSEGSSTKPKDDKNAWQKELFDALF